MKSFSLSKECQIHIGKQCGEEIKEAISNAKKSVKIVSPYLSPHQLGVVLNKIRAGLEVSIITHLEVGKGENPVREEKKKETYRSLLEQQRHTKDRAQAARNGLNTLFLCLAVGAGAVFFYSFGKPKISTTSAFLGCIFFLFCFSWSMKIRIYEYSYKPLCDLSVFFNSYSKTTPTSEYLVHSKIFIVDDEVAFVGSMNFTNDGMGKNYEIATKITNPECVQFLSDEIRKLPSFPGLAAVSLAALGKQIYEEPLN